MSHLTQEKYQRIWNTIQLIPQGKVASYGQIADLAGLPRQARLVGRSLGFVPNSINVPWHRVLRSNGHIAFAVGSEQSQKQIGLLQQENIAVFNNRVKLSEYQWSPDLAEMLWKLTY